MPIIKTTGSKHRHGESKYKQNSTSDRQHAHFTQRYIHMYVCVCSNNVKITVFKKKKIIYFYKHI